MWEIERLIDDENTFNWEKEVLKDGDNMKIWLNYYEIRSSEPSSIEQRIFILERAVRRFPRSFKLWKIYLDLCTDTYNNEEDGGILSVDTIKILFERSLRLLDTLPKIWTRYLKFLVHYCDEDVKNCRSKFNKAFRCLPITQHNHIWPLYINFAEKVGEIYGTEAYQRYLIYYGTGLSQEDVNGGNFNLTADQIIAKLIELGDISSSLTSFEAVINNSDSMMVSKKFDLSFWINFLDLFIENIIKSSRSIEHSTELDERFENLILHGSRLFRDQVAVFHLKVTQYFRKRGNFDKVRFYFKRGISECLTLNDFTTVYDALVEFEEFVIEKINKDLEMNPDNESLEAEIEFRMGRFDNLLKSRSLMKNDMMLRQDKDNLDEWFNRVDIFKEDLNKKIRTYAEALMSVNPLRAHSLSGNTDHTLPNLWIQYANIYSESGDAKTASLIFSKSFESQFKSVEDLALIYIEKSKMLLRNGDEDQAVNVLKEALTPKLGTNISSHKGSIEFKKNLYKCQSLWTFYLELLESLIDSENDRKHIELTIEEYERMISLKVLTPFSVINYASFLESWKKDDAVFSVYEEGIKLFNDAQIVYEIWSIYLRKAVDHGFSIERLRDLFDQCLFNNDVSEKSECPAEFCKSLFILYSQVESEIGSLEKAFQILNKSIPILTNAYENNAGGKQERDNILKDKFEIYVMIIEFSNDLKDIGLIRRSYENIVSDTQLKFDQFLDIISRFISFEEGQKQWRRVRELYSHACKLRHPDNSEISHFWRKWEQFELNNGDELTFKEMLRVKRQVERDFATQDTFRNSLNPMGFVKSSGKSIKTDIPKTDVPNPDSLDIDMDM